MSHETPVITAAVRERTGSRYAQRLRQEGRLPAVVYGHKTDPVHISVDEKSVLYHLHHGAHVFKVQIDGSDEETCLVKDLQFGYLGDNVIHIDFARVNLDDEVHVNVHLEFVGEPESAKKPGAILSHDLTELEVICKVGDIPESIPVDLTDMQQSFNVGELTLPTGLQAAADPETPVAHISFVHAEEAVGEEVEVEGEAAEPEVITEAKDKDDAEASTED